MDLLRGRLIVMGWSVFATRPSLPEEPVLVIAADHGSKYLVSRAGRHRCTDDSLLGLAVDLQALIDWEVLIVNVEPGRWPQVFAVEAADDLGEERDGLWLHDSLDSIRRPIARVLAGAAHELVPAADDDSLSWLWGMALHADGERLALQCLDRDAAAFGDVLPGYDRERDTPMHVAARHGHLTVLSRLVAAGRSPNLVGPDGTTPLHAAALAGQAEAARRLIELGADPLGTGTVGKTPLALALLFCPDARRHDIAALFWPIEWPAAAAVARHRKDYSPGR